MCSLPDALYNHVSFTSDKLTRLQPCHSPRVQFNVDTFSTSRIVESSQCERGSSPLRADTAGAYGRKSMDGKVVRYCNGEICRSWASCRRVRIRKTLLIEIHPPYVLQRGPQQFSPTYQLTCLYRMAPCQSVKEHCRNCIVRTFSLPSIDYHRPSPFLCSMHPLASARQSIRFYSRVQAYRIYVSL